jgi:spermidine synthase
MGLPSMSEHAPKPTARLTPVLREEDDGLTLVFDDKNVQSRMLPDEPARLVVEYTRLMMGFLLFAPAPTRIAMIGLGGGSLAKYCAQKLRDADFTAVEISPEVIALRDAFGIPPDGRRFRVVCEDGAAFVRRDGESFDVMLVDGFDGTGHPDQLCTAAFYDDCRLRLATAGVLVVNLYSDDADCDLRLERIRDVFAGRVVIIKADESENNIVFASADPMFPPPFRELVKRLRALAPLHPVSLESAMRKILQHTESQRAPHGRRRRR